MLGSSIRLLLFTLFVLSKAIVLAQDAQPGDACVAGKNGAYSFSGGAELSGIGHLLICNGTTWNRVFSFKTDGVLIPQLAASCNDGDALTFSSATGGLSCTPNCNDIYPSSFNFTDNPSAAISTLTESNILQITGINCQLNLEISGDGSPEYRTCSNSSCSSVLQSWTSGSSPISNNQYLQLRLTTSASAGVTRAAHIFVGNTIESWLVSPTGDCAAADPPIGTVCSDGTVFAGLSPDGSSKMYTTRCDEGMSWNGSICTGTRVTLPWNNGNITNYTITGATHYFAGVTNTLTNVAADSNSGSGGIQPHQASARCDTLSINGHTDWYLPSWSELSALYINQLAIGNFITNDYWSSTENDSVNARNVNFSNGSTENAGHITKGSTMQVRCVRK